MFFYNVQRKEVCYECGLYTRGKQRSSKVVSKVLIINLPTLNIHSGIKLSTKHKIINNVENVFSINTPFYRISQSGLYDWDSGIFDSILSNAKKYCGMWYHENFQKLKRVNDP